MPSVNVPSMANFHNPYSEALVLYRVDNAVLALTETVSLLSGQLLVTRRSGILAKPFYSEQYPLEVSFGNLPKVFFDGLPEEDLISGHLSSGV